MQAADFPVQNGCTLSRSKVVKFKHNDMEDLEAVLKREIAIHAKKRSVTSAVTEGNLYQAFKIRPMLLLCSVETRNCVDRC